MHLKCRLQNWRPSCLGLKVITDSIIYSYAYRHGPLVRYVKLRVVHAPELPGTFSPPPRVSDPGMHHGTCETHVPWCMPGSLPAVCFVVGDGENLPGIPGACATRNFTYLAGGPYRQTCHNGTKVRVYSRWGLGMDK